MIYDRFAAAYDILFAPLERLFLARWRTEALSMLPSDSRLLEVGAGTGLNFVHYPATSLAVASEPSGGMIRRAGARASAVKLVQADAQNLPFRDDSFDAAFGTLVFCSIPDPYAAFRELVRVVRPGGRLVFLEHVRPPGFKGRCFDVLNILTVALIDDHFNRETAEIAARSGLKVLEVRTKASGIVNLIVAENGDKKEQQVASSK
jgi:ubiquinone/menaquinone biosynthesis C-methylase UbiE